jgi:hypothetical protein
MAVQVRELIDEMIEIKEDMKPKEIKINLEKKRRYYEILDKRNKVELIKDSKFIPSKQAKPEYLFPTLIILLLSLIFTHFTHIFLTLLFIYLFFLLLID